VNSNTLHLHLGHLGDAFIQSDLQEVHLSKERQQYIASGTLWHYKYLYMHMTIFYA